MGPSGSVSTGAAGQGRDPGEGRNKILREGREVEVGPLLEGAVGCPLRRTGLVKASSSSGI